MQSGKRNTKNWMLSPVEEIKTRSLNPLMGWTSCDDTQTQLHFSFSTKEDAIDYAQTEGFEFTVEEPKQSSLKQKSYAANFTN